ncbi:hypothetical protein LEP1GSC198_2165 [Leptospira kirschneri str. JB]|nr:hypothetical protein LEP1GSC198_2165 [Leptospira kirschneri str. JB]
MILNFIGIKILFIEDLKIELSKKSISTNDFYPFNFMKKRKKINFSTTLMIHSKVLKQT